MQRDPKAQAKKIGACQSRADQQAPFQQRSLHIFVSERLLEAVTGLSSGSIL
jgi:hypothetical protein